MSRLLQLATALLLTTTLAHAQIQPPPPPAPQTRPNKKEKPAREDVEWIWQYTPTDTDKDGRENDLVQDLRFRPFLCTFGIPGIRISRQLARYRLGNRDRRRQNFKWQRTEFWKGVSMGGTGIAS